MKKLFLSLLLATSFISCRDEIKFNDPALEGQKDGVFWRAKNPKATLLNGNIILEGSLQDSKLTIVFPMPPSFFNKANTNAKTTYTMSPTTYIPGASFLSASDAFSFYETTSAKGPVESVKILTTGDNYTTALATTTSNSFYSDGLEVVPIVSTTGKVSAANIKSRGIGYAINDTITINGGDGTAKLLVSAIRTTSGEVVVTEFNGVGKIISGTFKFSAVNTSGDPLIPPFVNYQYGNFYLQLK